MSSSSKDGCQSEPDVEARSADLCSTNEPHPLPGQPVEPPFHVFPKWKKWCVVAIIGAAGLFSGLSSNIYFPSLHKISLDLGVDMVKVFYTITSYLVVQGLSPMIWGPLSDTWGRRPTYICSFLVYIAANIVLSFTPNYMTLLLFRALQSAGSASTVSIGNGVIQDITTSLERGSYIGFYQAIRNGSIAFGPIIGGLLAHRRGFRSIFVFLTFTSSAVLVTIIFCLPETLRSIAGNGAVRLSGIYKPLKQLFTKEPAYIEDPKYSSQETPKARKVTWWTFCEPIKMFKELDVLCTLFFGGVVYTAWSAVVASTTNIFKPRFGLNEEQLGLIFMPNGFGTMIGSSLAGCIMKHDFIHYEKRYLAAHPHAPPPSQTRNALPAEFQIERARLRRVGALMIVNVIATALYGFTLLPAPEHPTLRLHHAQQHPAWIGIPLTLQLLMAATSNAIFAINTTLITDFYPGCGAASTAVNNLVRCSMSAGGVALVGPMLNRFGPGVAFVVVAGVVAVSCVLVVMEWYCGMRWRAKRERQRKEKANRLAAEEHACT